MGDPDPIGQPAELRANLLSFIDYLKRDMGFIPPV